MFSLPSALLFAAVGGSIIDQFRGPRPAMIVSALICIAGDAVAFAAPSTLVLNIALLLSGLGFAGISVAGPAMIVTTSQGRVEVKAMSLWSTYAPTGFALGLLLAAPFATTSPSGLPLGLHTALTAAAVAGGFLLPGTGDRGPRRHLLPPAGEGTGRSLHRHRRTAPRRRGGPAGRHLLGTSLVAPDLSRARARGEHRRLLHHRGPGQGAWP